MIYTSGATADPKAVVHTHGAQIRHAWSLAQLYGFTEDVRTFTTMPFFWVGGLTVCLLSHLHVGAAVITVEKMDPPAMVELIERERATRLVGWTLLDRITGDPALADRDLSWLVELEASGSAPDPGLRHNSLGMSETCGPHTAAPSAEKEVDLPERLRGSFGPPVPGVQHKVVDPENPSVRLPDGIEGDLLVRGYSLMDGLYKKERSETFDEDGWYWTGDKGFFRDSYLFFTGRSTEMIKTGGANVAPREVELAIESLPGVQVAFVVGLPDAKRGQLVGCLVCPEPDAEIDPPQLTGQLRNLLSTYKIPRGQGRALRGGAVAALGEDQQAPRVVDLAFGRLLEEPDEERRCPPHESRCGEVVKGPLARCATPTMTGLELPSGLARGHALSTRTALRHT